MAELPLRDLYSMDTQQAVDALTDHMAIYHRSAERLKILKPSNADIKTNFKSGVQDCNMRRHRVIEWLSRLSTSQRQAALTIFDRPWVLLLLQMQQKLNENGPGNFIILPDIPAPSVGVRLDTEAVASHSTKHQKGKDKKGRVNSNTRRVRGSKASKVNNDENLEDNRKIATKSVGTLSNGNGSLADITSLPGLCYRKAYGLLVRLNSQKSAEQRLVKGVQIFSSQDGEKCVPGCGPQPVFDLMTVTNELAENLDVFLEVMEEISSGGFLEHPLGLAASPWEETRWLQVQGYYSVAAFIANKLEISIWSSYNFSLGSKRSSKYSWSSKTSESLRSNKIPGRCIDVLDMAAIAQSLHGRKRGCVDWWDTVGSDAKEKTVCSALVAATKAEVINASLLARNVARSSKPTKRSPELSRTSKHRGSRLKWTSLSDTEADQYMLNPQNDSINPTLSALLAGLATLKEVSELGFLSGGSSPSVTNNNCLFFSNLESVQTLSDRIFRRSRHVLARVMNEAVEFELLEGDVGAKFLAAESARLGENKGSKEKKKRRKRSLAVKISQEGKDFSNLADLTSQPLEEGELSRKEDVKGAVPHSQRPKLPNEVVGSPGFCTGNIQSSKPQIRKSKTRKHGKLTQTGSNVDINRVHEDKSHLDKFETNGIHRVYYEISHVNLVSGSCHSCDEGIKSNTNPGCNRGEAPAKFHSDLFVSIIEPSGNSSERVVPDAVDELNGSVTSTVFKTSDELNALEKLKIYGRNECLRQSDEGDTGVLLPVGEEPSAGQSRSEVFEVSTLRQSLEEPFDKPAVDSGKCDLDLPCMDHRSFELRFGTVDFVASGVQLPVNLKPSSTSNASAFHRTILELQLPRQEASENGRKSTGLSAPRIKEEGQIAASEVEASSEPVCHSNSRRSGLRSLSLPSGVYTPGKLFTSQPTPTFLPEESVLVHNLKGGSVRSQHNPPAFAMFYSHEWPGYSQVRVSGSTVRPTASERLHLDVVHKRLSASSVSISSTALAPPVSLDWPPFVHNGHSLTPVVGYSDSNKPKVVTLHSPFTSSSCASRTPPNGRTRIGDHDSEVEEHLYDTDFEIFEPHAGDFEDFDGYVVSEEEGERQVDDTTHIKAEDYNQFFGGGVMYWNSADYTGMGYSRPGSMSSDDSSWARREADLSVVLDDIVGIHPLPGSYRGKGSTSSNLSSTPSQPSTSLPLSLDQIGASQVGPCVCLTRSTGSDFSVNYGSISDDSLAAGPNVDTMRVVDGIMSDGFMPRLRPIVVVRDPGLSRSMVKTEAVRLREARSPHIVSRGVHQDFFGGRRRRPSPPVIRHAPPPPPPSPVAGLKRRKGWMSARSGSSSPRHWGLTSWWNKDDVDSFDIEAVNRDTVLGNRRRMGLLASTPPIRPGAVLRDHSVAMPPLALDQEHMADEALVMQSGLLYNKNPTLHLVMTVFHTALHKEIEIFCLQVAAEKRSRMPFINTAVKKVAHSLQVLWPRSRAKIFGSNATGLALPTSDVDLVVSLPPVRKAREPIKQAGILEGRIDGVKETCLLHAARNLEDQDWVKSLQVIEHTMVPIIRLKADILPHQCELGDISLSVKETCPMGTSSNTLDGSPTCQDSGDSAGKEGPWGSEKDRQNVCLDISFEAPTNTGVRTSELVRELMGQFPPLTPLALVLKQFLADRSLDHAYKGGLSSYCQVLLITRFLQHQQHLGRPSSSQNLGSLFMDFLHFFGYIFDPRSMCVRIRGGGKYVSRNRGPSIDPLYIEDPFDYENNVGSTCFRIQQIVKAFADANSILEKELFEASATDKAKVEDSFNLLQKIIPSFVGKNRYI